MPYLGRGGTSLGINFGTSAFVFQNIPSIKSNGNYQWIRYFETDEQGIPFKFPTINERYNTISQINFEKIPGSPIAYWSNIHAIEIFEKNKILDAFGIVRQGASTSDNNRFLRLWHEVVFSKIGFDFKNLEDANLTNYKWFPYNKGGVYRKWYGNHDYLINYEKDGYELKQFQSTLSQGWTVRLKSREYYFNSAVSWPKITSGSFSARFYPDGFIFDVAGCCYFPKEAEKKKAIVGFLNSKVARLFLDILSPTLNYEIEQVKKLPFLDIDNSKLLVLDGIYEISKKDWDSRENSWKFQQNELIKQKRNTLSESFIFYKQYWTAEFFDLHKNEENLNKEFIELFGLQKVITPNVRLEEITILQEESKIINGELFIDPTPVLLQLLSYSIGCIFGRYSLDKPGLILANQGETIQDFLKEIPSPTFMPDEDNIIPVLEGEWFTDDIIGRFKVFLKAAFGEEHFEENLKYIEETIGKDIRKYFVKDFYNDHIKRYKKRPIYWMFSSPKGHFKALIYMHRYQPDLCSKMLNDYLQAFISKLEATKQTQTMLSLREDISAREKTIVIKEIDKYEAMLKDCRAYEKTLFTIATQKISIDLDDGVKVNCQKFKEVLVPIKGLEKEEE